MPAPPKVAGCAACRSSTSHRTRAAREILRALLELVKRNVRNYKRNRIFGMRARFGQTLFFARLMRPSSSATATLDVGKERRPSWRSSTTSRGRDESRCGTHPALRAEPRRGAPHIAWRQSCVRSRLREGRRNKGNVLAQLLKRAHSTWDSLLMKMVRNVSDHQQLWANFAPHMHQLVGMCMRAQNHDFLVEALSTLSNVQLPTVLYLS